MKSVLQDFCSRDVLCSAKMQLLNDVNGLKSELKNEIPHVAQHRDNENHGHKEVDNLILSLTFVD